MPMPRRTVPTRVGGRRRYERIEIERPWWKPRVGIWRHLPTPGANATGRPFRASSGGAVRASARPISSSTGSCSPEDVLAEFVIGHRVKPQRRVLLNTVDPQPEVAPDQLQRFCPVGGFKIRFPRASQVMPSRSSSLPGLFSRAAGLAPGRCRRRRRSRRGWHARCKTLKRLVRGHGQAGRACDRLISAFFSNLCPSWPGAA